jgi:hypothetical protein
VVLDDIRKQMGELGIGHVTIQLEVEDHCAEEPGVAPADPHGHGHLHHHHHH